MTDLPVFVHDTRRIINCNDAACSLFRCDAVDLIDRDMLDLIPDEMGRSLASLRLRAMRDSGKLMRDITYPFRRFDNSVFLARLKTVRLDDGQFETTLIYEDEE